MSALVSRETRNGVSVVVVTAVEYNRTAEVVADMLAALRDVMAAQSGNPKSCGHEFTCICPYDAARAAIVRAEGRGE